MNVSMLNDNELNTCRNYPSHWIYYFYCVHQLSVYTALKPNGEGGQTLIHKEEQFDVNIKFERLVGSHDTLVLSDGLSLIILYFLSFSSIRLINVSLPKKTRNNGTLYALVFVHQAGVSPWQDPQQVHSVVQLTTYMVPKPPEISLISGEDQTLVSVTTWSVWDSL